MVVDGSAIRVGDTDAIEHDGLFLRTVELEETIISLSCKYISDDVLGIVGGSHIVTVDLHDAIFITTDCGSSRCAEGDGNCLAKRGVLDIVIIAAVDLDRLRDGILVESHSKRGHIAIARNTRNDVVRSRGALRVVVITLCDR